jgi:hypothetical protein
VLLDRWDTVSMSQIPILTIIMMKVVIVIIMNTRMERKDTVTVMKR